VPHKTGAAFVHLSIFGGIVVDSFIEILYNTVDFRPPSRIERAFVCALKPEGGYFYERILFSRASSGLTAVDAGFHYHHIGQRDLDAGQFDVRLRAESARAGLHGLEPALRHLYCDIYAAADRHADLLGRDPRPLFAQEDDLHAGLPFLRGLPCRCADPEPRLVQLSDARGLLLYHRLDQQHLLCRLRQLLSPADL